MLLQFMEAAISNSFAKLSARLTWYTAGRGMHRTHEEGKLRGAIIPRRIVKRRVLKERVNLRGCLLLCSMVKGVGKKCHIVVQTVTFGNGQRFTSPCKK